MAELIPPLHSRFAPPTPETGRPPFANELRSYAPTESGAVYATAVHTESGETLSWRDQAETRRFNRKIMLTTESGQQYYVYGDRIFDMDESYAQGKPVSIELSEDEPLPDATIGQAWETPRGQSDPIAKVEILHGIVEPNKDDSRNANSLKGDLLDYMPTNEDNQIAQAAEWLSPFQVGGYDNNPKLTASKFKSLAKNALSKVNETVVNTSERAFTAMLRAKQRGAAVAKNAAGATAYYGMKAIKNGSKAARYAQAKSFEYGVKANLWRDIKVAELGAFAVALQTELPSALNNMKTTHENLGSYKEKNLKGKLGHIAMMQTAFAYEAKHATKVARARKKSVTN